MKTAVVYYSQTGFTARYAQWIAAETGADCFAYAQAKGKDFSQYGAIVFGGSVFVGSVKKLRWFEENLERWQGKKLAVFCVGASPMEGPEVQSTMAKNFGGDKWKNVAAFYCPGGLNYEKLPAPSRLVMKVLLKFLKAEHPQTAEEEKGYEMLSASFDLSDKKYIAPILEWWKQD